MTVRDRILAVLYQREPDKVPLLQYDGLILPNERFWSEFGRANVGILHRSRGTKFISRECGIRKADFTEGRLRGQYSVMHTPKGDLKEKILFDPALDSPARVEHFVKKPADYEILLEYLRDLTVVPDTESYLRCDEYVGDSGIPMVCVSRTPFQQMWVWWVSLEDLCVDMADHAEIVSECLERLSALAVAELTLVAEMRRNIPFPLLDFPDNITAPAIGKEYFGRYCVPFYNKARELLDDGETIIAVHMDGDLKPLWPQIAGSSITALESFTPPPDSDTTVTDALSLRDDLRLLVNFTSSVHLRPAEEIYAHALALLREGAPSGKMWFQLSENMPPGAWKKSLPMILKAIDDYAAEG